MDGPELLISIATIHYHVKTARHYHVKELDSTMLERN